MRVGKNRLKGILQKHGLTLSDLRVHFTNRLYLGFSIHEWLTEYEFWMIKANYPETELPDRMKALHQALRQENLEFNTMGDYWVLVPKVQL